MTLPLCIIGAGSIGQRHIEVATASDNVTLTAVVEPNDALRADLHQKGLPAIASVDEAPAQTRAAIVATPTPDHIWSAQACLANGWGVLIEKPIAANLGEARVLVHQSARTGLPVFTGHHRRCHPFSRAARDAITHLGAPVGIQGLWSLRKHDRYYDVDWRRAPGAGPLMTNLTHEIDLLRFLIGDIVETSALLSSAQRQLAIEDTAALNFRFANGALGSFLISDAGASPWSFEAASYENPAIAGSGQDYLRITGTQGALAFPSLTTWGRSQAGEIEWSVPLRETPGQPFARIDPLRAQLDRFAHVMDGGQDDVLCTAKDGLRALEITLAAALSGQLGRPIRADEIPASYKGVLNV